MRIALAVLGGVALIIVGNLVWRWLSRRRSLPCPSWLSWGLEGRFFSWLYRTDTTLQRIGLKPGDRVLEVGPGPGRLLLPAARRVLPGGQAVGLDVQAPMIAKLKDRASAAGVHNLTAIVGDAADVSPPGKFDAIFVALTLGEIPRQKEFLARALDALRPGGRISVTELFPDPHFLTQQVVQNILEEAGFEHVETLGSRWFYTSNFQRPKHASDDSTNRAPERKAVDRNTQ